MSAGIAFFTKKQNLRIKITNIKEVTLNTEYFQELVGLELPASLVYQAWYEEVGGEKFPGASTDGKEHFAIKFKDIKEAFEKQRSSVPKIFEELFAKAKTETDLEAPAHLVSTAAEILEN